MAPAVLSMKKPRPVRDVPAGVSLFLLLTIDRFQEQNNNHGDSGTGQVNLTTLLPRRNHRQKPRWYVVQGCRRKNCLTTLKFWGRVLPPNGGASTRLKETIAPALSYVRHTDVWRPDNQIPALWVRASLPPNRLPMYERSLQVISYVS